MADATKRSRKCRLEVRDDDIYVEETENSLLQAIPPPPKVQRCESKDDSAASDPERHQLLSEPPPLVLLQPKSLLRKPILLELRESKTRHVTSSVPQVPTRHVTSSVPQVPTRHVTSSVPQVPTRQLTTITTLQRLTPSDSPQSKSHQDIQTAEHPRPKSFQTKLPDNLDHTYARVKGASPALQLDVKVEVEEVDESINKSTKSQATATRKKVIPPKTIPIFEVNLEEMYKIAENIYNTSTNIADKYLSIYLKNVWGSVLKPQEDTDLYNEAIQKALFGWGCTLIGNKYRDSPLFYQCHICNLAWWYLGPFKEHINAHDPTKIRLYHQDNGHESFIVASDTDNNGFKYIPCEGNCYRCGNPYSFHVKLGKEVYKCKRCYKKLETCLNLQLHEVFCEEYVPITYSKKKTCKCSICSVCFYTEAELEVHMISAHQVRSDIVSHFSFKTCTICHKKYQCYFVHMCIRSSKSAACMYCFRKFHTKTLQEVHYQTGEENYKCRICETVLEAQCMETEHLMTHTNKFKKVFKCIHHSCPSSIVFPDRESVKVHRALFHKQKYDKRRTYFEMVIIPEQCYKTGFVQVLDGRGETEGIRIRKITVQEAEDEDWCVSPAPETPAARPADQDDDVIIVKQEEKEIETIDLDSHDESDEEMGYAKMLSKVFKVSDEVKKPAPTNLDPMHTQIKVEFSDIDSEEDIITIKQEPFEACLGRSFIDTCQTDSCQGNSQYDSCLKQNARSDSRNDGCPSASLADVDTYSIDSISSQTDSQTDTEGVLTIKTEPQALQIEEIFGKITKIKTEPVNIKQELIECTEANVYNGANVICAGSIIPSRMVVSSKNNIKPVEKNSQSLLKDPKLEASQSVAVEVKQNAEEISDEEDSKFGKDKDFKIRVQSGKSKYKRVKYDAEGRKMKKLYSCAHCGYTQRHKLYQIHRRSLCHLSPSDKIMYNQFVCTKCCTGFKSLKTYLGHFPKHGYAQLECPCCYTKFEFMKDLIPHFYKHVKQSYVNCWRISEQKKATKRQQRCLKCRQIVPPAESFSHWESHFQPKDDVVEQKETTVPTVLEPAKNKRAMQPTALHRALKQLRDTGREKSCTVCSRTFNRRCDAKRHIVEHLLRDAYSKKDTTDTNKLRCQICADEFASPDKYKFHMREHGALPVYRCELCDKTFSDSSNFAKHKKIHNLRVVICDTCGKKFQAKSSLEKHIKMHLTTEPFKCEECGRLFYTPSQYYKHVHVRKKAAHVRSKVRCAVCEQTFDSLREKWEHAWNVHKERRHKADCPICHVEFRRHIDVKKHAKLEHDMELRFYNMKSEGGEVNNFNMFCKIKKKKPKKGTFMVLYDDEDSD